ncbi:alpha/beta hydrolase [Psychroserpens sp. BH13MA-6]
MKYIIPLFLVLLGTQINAQERHFESQDLSINEHIDGTLLIPKGVEQPKLAIIIAGSGPTDRNGNQNFLKNNSLKKLAESLSNQGIATFRYDKRIVKQIREHKVDPNITFDDFVTDAISVVTHFKEESQFGDLIVIGHSQGSLIGMLAAKDRADGFISLAGAGQPIDEVITEQITAMDPSLEAGTKKAFAQLKKGELVTDYPPALASVFSADVQPFIMNWMQYQPQEVLASLDMPTLIVNGTKDLQVSVDEAKLLKAAAPNSELEIITNMNHVLFIIEGDQLENSKSYNESSRKISEALISAIVQFMKS